VFTVVGRPDLAADPAYYSPAGRSAHGGEIDMIVADWIAQRTLAEAIKVFNDNDCAVAKVYDAQALLSDRHLAARGTFAPVADPDLGSMRVQVPVARFSATPSRIDHLGAALGAHNDAVYGGLLGLNEADLSRLQADGTI
jgi:crotonobetainyl-CoA:carnitine CoA-transferase CaiB-like acyl-CoA transferase